MAENVGNKWSALLNGAIDNDDTSLAYDGAVGTLPSVNFRIVVQDSESDDTNREIMLVTAGTSSPLTVTRAQEGTTEVSHGDNSYVVHVLTAGGLTALMAERAFAGCSIYHSTTQNPSNPGVLAFDSELYDTDGFHSTVTNTSRVTIPTGKDGKYLFTIGAASSSATNPLLRLKKNGTTVVSPNFPYEAAAQLAGSWVVDLAASDYIEVERSGTGTLGHASAYEAQCTLTCSLIGVSSTGSIARTALGTTGIGGSFDSTAKTVYKKISVPQDSFLASIAVAGKGQSAGGFELDTFVMSDNAGTPLNVLATSGTPTRSGAASTGTAHTHNLQSSVGVINATARFITTPIGLWVTAGDYWIGVAWNGNAANDWQIAYSSGTGSDRTKASTDGPYDHSAGASSTGTNDFSIYANMLMAGGSVVVSSGTSFPSGPSTNQRFFRTDRGLDYFYDGTRWLTVTEYEAPGIITSAAGQTADANIYLLPIRADGDTYLTKFYASTRVIVAATWVVHLMQITTAGAQNDIATLSTAGDSANTETRHETDINALVPNTTFHLCVFLDEQTGATSCTASVGVRYRRVG